MGNKTEQNEAKGGISGAFVRFSENPKVSLIITVYNKAPFLRRCLDSIVNQTDKSSQIIIVDDESTDKSKEICKEYCKRNNWEYYRIKHSGVSVARNFGLDKAKGKYVSFLDVDDSLVENALEIYNKIIRHGFNIYQFGQYRCHRNATYKDRFQKGFHKLDSLPRRWAMVWNKLYKKSFISGIRFIEGLQFGEDEIFNVRCILRNDGLYHAPQTLINHYFDDKESLCRGELSVERLERLIKELDKLRVKQKNPVKKKWIENKIKAHEESALFKRFGYNKNHPTGKYDIVYFLKQSRINEELRYSLRSVEENWQYNRVWFYGGCPEGIRPDKYVHITQFGLSKYDRVRNMMYEVCLNDEITEDFWLFNDDFFILKKKKENMPAQYNRSLEDRIRKIEKRHNGPTDYTRRLRHLVKTLKTASKGTLDYAVHKPILINRKRMLEVLKMFPNEPMIRALYGNYWNIGGVSNHDMKIQLKTYNKMNSVMKEWDFLSTSDESFRDGNVGRYLRDRFKEKSRFEL